MAIGPPVTIHDEIACIREACAARDPWAVLGIPPGSSYKQIKSAQRRWIRELHPDRWYAVADEQLRHDIQEAFYQVQGAYYEALKRAVAALQGNTAYDGPITPPSPGPQSSGSNRVCTSLRRLFAFIFRRHATQTA